MTFRLAVALAIGVALLAVPPVRCDGLVGLLDVLQPGARAAPGLGGDPFASPLEDGAGWWAAGARASEPGERLRMDWSAPVRGASGLDARALEWAGARAFTLRRTAVRVGVAADRHDRAQWLGLDPGTLRVSGSGGLVRGVARAEGPAPGVLLQATGPLWREGGGARPEGAGAGVRWRPGAWFTTAVHVERARVPERFASDLYGESIRASLNLALARWQADARVILPGALALEGSTADSRFRPLETGGRALDYRLEPDGSARTTQLAIGVGSAPVRALVRWTHARLDLDGEARWGGERFAWLSYVRADAHAWLAGVERTTPRARLLLDVERGEITASARGSVESWPFTDATADLLGLRGIGRAAGAARWWRAHVAGERQWSRAWRARGGLSWYDADLGGRLETWRPTFLVFGVSDYRAESLPWSRAQLAILSAGLTWRGRAIAAEASVQQPVFGRAFERTGGPPGTAGDPGAPATGTGPPSLRETGTSLRLALHRAL